MITNGINIKAKIDFNWVKTKNRFELSRKKGFKINKTYNIKNINGNR